MDIYQSLVECEGFEWDKGNILKSWEKYKVSASECEQIFFNIPLIAVQDAQHSQKEPRYFALGCTDAGRHLFIVFTIRENLIRVISARDKRYEQEGKEVIRNIMKKRIPKFKSEAEEQEFWSKTDSIEYIEWEKVKRMVLPKLKPSLKTISLRLPEVMLEELKLLANKRDIPYQSLLKMFLSERIEKELKYV